MARVFFLTGFSYLATLFLASYLNAEVLPYTLISLGICFLICVCVKKIRREKTILLSLFTCTIAVLVSFLNYNNVVKPIKNLDDKEAVISGKIVDIPYKKYGRYNYILDVTEIDSKKTKPFKIKMTSSEPLEADICENFKGKVRFYTPKSNVSFDSERYYRSKNIHILAYAYNFEPYEVQDLSSGFDIQKEILKLRERMLSMPRRIFPERMANVMNGFILGEKHSFPEDIKNNFDRIGVYHLLATSAVHISVLSEFLSMLLRKLRLGRRQSALLTCAGILFFMAINCFTPSVMRSGIMMIIYNLGKVFFRQSDPLNSLGIAILIMCLPNPSAALDISLWMSVLSSLGIILFERKIYYFISEKLKLENQSKILKYFILIISANIAVSAFTFPMAAWFFKKLSLIHIISNLLIIPPATLLLNCLTVLQTFMLFDLPKVIFMPVAYICGLTTNLIIDISSLLAKIPFAMLSLDYGFVNLCLAFSLILFGISLLFKKYKNMMKLSMILAAVLHISGAAIYIIFTINTTRIAIPQCSDGISLVISKGFKKSVILFTGEKFSSLALDDYLSKNRESVTEHLILIGENPQNTEYVNSLVSNLKPKKIFADKSLEINDKNPKISHLENNANLEISENLKIETFKQENYHFAFIKIYDKKILISFDGGDALKIPEKYRSCDFLILGKLFLNYKKIKAENIIISAGKTDSEIFINKLTNTVKNIFSTAHDGNIYIDLNKDKYTIRRSY